MLDTGQNSMYFFSAFSLHLACPPSKNAGMDVPALSHPPPVITALPMSSKHLQHQVEPLTGRRCGPVGGLSTILPLSHQQVQHNFKGTIKLLSSPDLSKLWSKFPSRLRVPVPEHKPTMKQTLSSFATNITHLVPLWQLAD